jgi:hypothetical protein
MKSLFSTKPGKFWEPALVGLAHACSPTLSQTSLRKALEAFGVG